MGYDKVHMDKRRSASKSDAFLMQKRLLSPCQPVGIQRQTIKKPNRIVTTDMQANNGLVDAYLEIIELVSIPIPGYIT